LILSINFKHYRILKPIAISNYSIQALKDNSPLLLKSVKKLFQTHVLAVLRFLWTVWNLVNIYQSLVGSHWVLYISDIDWVSAKWSLLRTLWTLCIRKWSRIGVICYIAHSTRQHRILYTWQNTISRVKTVKIYRNNSIYLYADVVILTQE
jgi:hypothetical protein